MATYKLIQDIEAEDKLLGPLSFRQFIYALVAVFLLYLSYLLYAHHGEIFDVITVPMALFAGFLAYPFGKDQPTELWALAKLRFLIKPRRRIWAQSGIKEQVTITVPKKEEVQLTNGLSQTEVKSRLQALANTIDSRGWATKNINSIYQNPFSDPSSDRLISAQALVQNIPDDIPDTEDPYNEQYSPIAQQVDQLLSANNSKHRQELIDHLNTVRADVSTHTTPQIPQVQGTVMTPMVNDLPTENEIENELHNAYAKSHASLSNMHALRNKIYPQPAAIAVHDQAPNTKQGQSTPASNPVIMNLSKRNDLNVNVISNEANRAMPKKTGSDEVLISLH